MIIYQTAFEALKPYSLAIDMLLGLLVQDAPNITGWHQVVRVREPPQPYYRTFDLIDDEDLGPSYKDRHVAKRVSSKAVIHYARHKEEIYKLILSSTGLHPNQFTHERDYFRAMASARGHMLETLRALHSLHRSLVSTRQLKEAA